MINSCEKCRKMEIFRFKEWNFPSHEEGGCEKSLFLVRSFQPTLKTTQLGLQQGTQTTFEILLLHKVRKSSAENWKAKKILCCEKSAAHDRPIPNTRKILFLESQMNVNKTTRRNHEENLNICEIIFLLLLESDCVNVSTALRFSSRENFFHFGCLKGGDKLSLLLWHDTHDFWYIFQWSFPPRDFKTKFNETSHSI